MMGAAPRFLLDALVKPLFALVFFLGFGGFFVFGGFQTVQVDLARGSGNSVIGTITNSHFFGLYIVSTKLTDITGASIVTKRSRRSATNPASMPVSGLVLNSAAGSTPVFWGFTNVGEAFQERVQDTLNRFIRNGDAKSFHETYVIRNLFGWIGLPFFVIGILAVVGWPVSGVLAWRKHFGRAGPV